ncbi:hypothetical protein Taro_052420, partial [Colocasia esculenta]|nr:hypothetical protein [Colocasia esculenta]
DALLASIAESEQQTELATRVSTWKQKIEHTLEDQDSRPPFDIQQYGEKILDKLHVEAGNEARMCFTDIVMGQPKHDIARTFSALLQLVNNGDVDLENGQAMGESICYTSAIPFFVRLHGIGKREVKFHSLKKRVKSPLRKGCLKLDSSSSKSTCPVKSPHQNDKVSMKLGKGNVSRCTPESKRRRRSRLVAPIDLPSAR